MIRRLLLVTFALILSWAGVVQPGLCALASPAEFVHVYAHGSHHHTAVLTFTTTERGPPAGYSNATAYDADGILPPGGLTRPEGTTTPAIYDYDDAARLCRLHAVATVPRSKSAALSRLLPSSRDLTLPQTQQTMSPRPPQGTRSRRSEEPRPSQAKPLAVRVGSLGTRRFGARQDC